MNWNKVAKRFRFILIIGLLIWITYESYLHQILGGGKAASVHALCPFGALESLYSLLFLGSFIKKVYTGTVVLLGLMIFITVFFRRSFCGLICPFGALQELLGKIGKKVFKKRFIITKKIDRPLRYLKYVFLMLTVGMAWRLGILWMSPLDPYSAYSHLLTASATIEEDPIAVVGFILLAITLVGSFLYDRFFCKYLCPVGAFNAMIGKVSFTRIQRNDNLCIHCKACNKVCPVNIEVEKAVKVTSAECISCNECVLICPKKGALEIKAAKKTVHPFAILLIVVFLFFGTLLTVQISGNFEILPASLNEGQIISFTEVKGYYTIEETAAVTGLSLKEVYEKLDIPESISKGTKLKEISKKVPGFNLEKVKERLK